MKKNRSALFLIPGVCLILTGFALMIFFQVRMDLGARQGKHILSKMAQILPERTAGVPESHPDHQMPVLEIDGMDYAAMLEIPSVGLTLPVADKWDSGRLHVSPARFWGSVYDGSLIIGGADDPRQFSFCDRIGYGSTVIVTDMTGAQFTYSVSKVGRAKHADPRWLMNADCDLTLFVHDVLSMEYIAVRCDLNGSQ